MTSDRPTLGPDKIIAEQTNPAVRGAGDKRAYSTPILRVYGSVIEFTKGSRSTGIDFGFGNSRRRRRLSERAAKEHIIRIGTHPLGIGVYLFDYRPEFQQQYGYGRQFGVMADEVEAVSPEAVSISSSGYKVVDYESLGIWQFDIGQPDRIWGVQKSAESGSRLK